MAKNTSAAVCGMGNYSKNAPHSSPRMRPAGRGGSAGSAGRTPSAGKTSPRTALPKRMPAWVQRELDVYPPGMELARLANRIAERAWSRTGIRVFMWPCGSVVAVRVMSAADTKLLRRCSAQLIGTWAQGATLHSVMTELRWARLHA